MSMDHSKRREGCILWKLKTRRSYVQYLTVNMLAFPAKGGCRKHVSKHHGWYYYFDEPPQVTIEPRKDVKQTSGLNVTTNSVIMKVPGMLENNAFANEFLDWMSSPLVVEEVKIMQSK